MPWDRRQAEQLGDTVRRLRLEKQLSQETLAFGAGITKNQVQLIESGRSSGRADASGPSNPRMATLVGLAEVLEVTVSDLMRGADL